MAPEAVADQLADLRQTAEVLALRIQSVAVQLEEVAQEALAVAQTDEESESALQLLAAARRARHGSLIRRSLFCG